MRERVTAETKFDLFLLSGRVTILKKEVFSLIIF